LVVNFDGLPQHLDNNVALTVPFGDDAIYWPSLCKTPEREKPCNWFFGFNDTFIGRQKLLQGYFEWPDHAGFLRSITGNMTAAFVFPM